MMIARAVNVVRPGFGECVITIVILLAFLGGSLYLQIGDWIEIHMLDS